MMHKIYKNSYILLIILITTLNGTIFTAYSQDANQYQISGVVVDEETGESLPGVAIVIGTGNQRAITDLDGKFTLRLSQSPIEIQFSFVGMKKQVISVNRETKDLIVKLISSTQLAEVVIEAGYGLAQKRSDMVGSAFQVQSEDLQSLPPARLDKMLDGLIPGLNIEPNTDSPGSPRTRFNIRVRGEASLSASNEPLWIVDGVPVYQGTSTNMMPGTSYTVSPLSYLNPEDIESITVLKDASSTSIYGANGANGVIIVKTKSGAVGSGLRISSNLRYGISKIDKSTMYKVMNARQHLAYAKEAWVNGGNDINAFPYQDNELNNYSGTDTNWRDLYFQPGNTIDAGFSIRSGGEKSSNYLSMGYFTESGTVKGNTQQRFSGRFNSDYKLTKKLNLRTSISASYNENDIFPLGREYYEVLPIFTPYMADGYTNRLYNRIVNGVSYDDDGNPVLNWTDQKFFSNRIPNREDNTNIQRTYQTDGNIILRYEILKGLVLTEQFGISIKTSNEEVYDARTTLAGIENNDPRGYSRRASVSYMNWNNIFRLNYNQNIGDFRLGLLTGIELQSNKYNTLYATGSGFLNDHIQEVGYSEAASRNGYSSRDQKRSLSYLGQAQVSYLDRYFFAANARADGNSSFGKYARWARFGSIGLSWNINNESFFDYDFVDLLKLKASIGTNGNSRIDSSINTGTYTYSNTYSYNGTLGATIGTIPNPGLSWEATTMYNVGLRVELFKRLSAEIEVYNNHTKNLLNRIYTSRTISDDRLYANVGEIQNRGLELTLNSENINKVFFISDKALPFSWRTDLIFSQNRNKIVKMYNGMTTSFGTTVWKEGYPRSAFFLVRWAGVDPATGAPMWYDKDDNITFTYTTDDRVMLEKEKPESWATGSLTNTFSLGNFSFRFMLNYMLGGYTLSTQAGIGMRDGYDAINTNAGIEAEEHWREPGELAINPRISTVSSKSSMSSTRYLYSKTNIRLQNTVLSYSIPKKQLQKIGVEGGSISLIGDNLYLWTPDQRKGNNSYKTLMNAYPIEKNFSISLNLSL